MKIAFRRFAIVAALLGLASFLYYRLDEFSIAHEELDGYIPYLLFLRLALGILVASLFFVLVYPLRMLIISAAVTLRQKRRSLAPPPDERLTAIIEAVLAAALYLLATGGAYLLLRSDIDYALLPLGGMGWLTEAFKITAIALTALLGLWLLYRLWNLFTLLQARRPAVPKPVPAMPMMAAPVPAPAPAHDAPTVSGNVYCGACGNANAAGSVFCEQCGERMGQ